MMKAVKYISEMFIISAMCLGASVSISSTSIIPTLIFYGIIISLLILGAVGVNISNNFVNDNEYEHLPLEDLYDEYYKFN